MKIRARFVPRAVWPVAMAVVIVVGESLGAPSDKNMTMRAQPVDVVDFINANAALNGAAYTVPPPTANAFNAFCIARMLAAVPASNEPAGPSTVYVVEKQIMLNLSLGPREPRSEITPIFIAAARVMPLGPPSAAVIDPLKSQTNTTSFDPVDAVTYQLACRASGGAEHELFEV